MRWYDWGGDYTVKFEMFKDGASKPYLSITNRSNPSGASVTHARSLPDKLPDESGVVFVPEYHPVFDSLKLSGTALSSDKYPAAVKSLRVNDLFAPEGGSLFFLENGTTYAIPFPDGNSGGRTIIVKRDAANNIANVRVLDNIEAVDAEWSGSQLIVLGKQRLANNMDHGLIVKALDANLSLQGYEAHALTSEEAVYSEGVYDLETDPSGNLYVVAGIDASSLQFGNKALHDTTSNYFVGRLDSTLNWQWQAKGSVSAGNINGLGAISYNPASSSIFFAGALTGSYMVSSSNQAESDITVAAGGSFLTMLGSDNGSFTAKARISLVSDYGVDEQKEGIFSVYKGGRTIIYPEGSSITVAAPAYYYTDAAGEVVRDSKGQLLTSLADDDNPAVVTRYVCEGFSVDGEVVNSTAHCSYRFSVSGDRTISFKWRVEHLLELGASGLNDTTTTSGADTSTGTGAYANTNASPAIGRHWIAEGETVNIQIDSVIADASGNSSIRHRLSGAGFSKLAAADSRYAAPDNGYINSVARQQISHFTMKGPLLLQYSWVKQHLVQISSDSYQFDAYPRVYNQKKADGSYADRFDASLEIQEETGKKGSGNYWVDEGAAILLAAPTYVGATRKLSGWKYATGIHSGSDATNNVRSLDINSCGQDSGFEIGVTDSDHTGLIDHVDTIAVTGIGDSGALGDNPVYCAINLYNLGHPVALTWSFGIPTFVASATVGQGVDLGALLNQAVADTTASSEHKQAASDILAKMTSAALLGKAPSQGVVAGDSVEALTYQDFILWSGKDKSLYPLRDGKVSLEWSSSADNATGLDNFRIEISLVWPPNSDASYRYFVENTPPVLLDRETADNWYFLKTGYSRDIKGSGVIVDGYFDSTVSYAAAAGSSDTRTLSSLVFTCGAEGSVMTGDTDLESVCVRVVETIRWNDAAILTSGENEAVIGSALEALGNAPHSGYVIGKNAYYNAAIHDREALSGPIIPVNAEVSALAERKLNVMWYRSGGTLDKTYWPFTVRYYKPTWPEGDQLQRIVIASGLGSDGKSQADVANGRSESTQPVFDPEQYLNLKIYRQNDEDQPGYNPNEEHALLAPSKLDNAKSGQMAAYALRTDLNMDSTSRAYVLVQYQDASNDNAWGMQVYQVVGSDTTYPFSMSAQAGEAVAPLYPIARVNGVQSPAISWGKPVANDVLVYWEDRKHDAWVVSGGHSFDAYFWYHRDAGFDWPLMSNGDSLGSISLCYLGIEPTYSNRNLERLLAAGSDCTTGVTTTDYVPMGDVFVADGNGKFGLASKREGQAVRVDTSWPANTAVLKAGETLTFSGGEKKNDGDADSGLPGVLAFKSAEIIFDSYNPSFNPDNSYAARIVQVLEERRVDWGVIDTTSDDFFTRVFSLTRGEIELRKGNYFFPDLPASLQNRIFYDPANHQLVMRGYVNGKTAGDSSLTATPGAIYTVQPNIMSVSDRDHFRALSSNANFQKVVDDLFRLTRDPGRVVKTVTPASAEENAVVTAYNEVNKASRTIDDWRCVDRNDALDDSFYYVGMACKTVSGTLKSAPVSALGTGLALIPGAYMLDSTSRPAGALYVTVVENNDTSLDGDPVALHVIKVDAEEMYRGNLQVLAPENVFSEKVNIRHTADFGARGDKIVFEWWYREDSTLSDLKTPDTAAPGQWTRFAQPTGQEGANEIVLDGAAPALLADNVFYAHYRHSDCPAAADNKSDPYYKCWSPWAGAANNNPSKGVYQGQLSEGWIKRVIDHVNLFEARISDFYNSDSPATYSSMIQQAGAAYNGPVALNSDKDVIENAGLIQLYETVLQRAESLSINATNPYQSPGVYNAIQLAASRLAQLYTLMANEAYVDALDPTIGFTTASGEFGGLASYLHAFMDQSPSLLDEELALLRGTDQYGAFPYYNRLIWNFTMGDGEVAYARNYGIYDVDSNGVIDENDAQILYPQGHGDAWGHYTKALDYYYDLLVNQHFSWQPTSEHVSVAGSVVEVDFHDERRFAELAAARAKAGRDIVDLTYRASYTENPSGQWQGYKDQDRERAWGVSDWAQRTVTGSYLDWLTANAMLPAADDSREGIARVDRTTVPDLRDIAAQTYAVIAAVNRADNGQTPLGTVPDAVPFDIDPARVSLGAVSPASHFEQIAERAEQALENAFEVFDYANTQRNRVREVANTAQEMLLQAQQQDIDYRNRLIEIFGTPYQGTIGSGKTYAAGYDGPDIYYYQYLDVSDITTDSTYGTILQGKVAGILKDTLKLSGDLDAYTSSIQSSTLATAKTVSVDMELSSGLYAFQKPDGWGARTSPGKIQNALMDVVTARANLEMAMDDYNTLVDDIEVALQQLEAFNVYRDQIIVNMTANKESTSTTLDYVTSNRNIIGVTEAFKDETDWLLEASVEALPKILGLASDTTSPIRSALLYAGIPSRFAYGLVINSAETKILDWENEQALKDLQLEIDQANLDFDYDVVQQLGEIQNLLNNEGGYRYAFFKAREQLRQAIASYQSVLGEGLRLMDEREVFNQRIASKVQGERYKDMTFRLTQYDALQKYRSAFDYAARNVYLAARAYDYETNLDSNDQASAQPIMDAIIKARTLGERTAGGAFSGAGGLSEQLGILKANYSVLKGQMGFNNPQTETGRFSLRKELFRIKDGSENDALWRRKLGSYLVADLWQQAEFKRYVRSPIPESYGALPGLVIPFTSSIEFGKNFFGLPLSGGDHAYDASHFATRIRSVGLWFDNYDGANLAETPRAYLVPVGLDLMYVPNSSDLATREWHVVDQTLPVPVPIGNGDLNDSGWVPGKDGQVGDSTAIRRFSSFRAYHDNGDFSADEMTYDSRLVGRSVWNTRWLLIIPGGTFLTDGDEGLQTFIYGSEVPSASASSSTVVRDGNGITDIKLFFQTYSYSGN